MNYESGLAAVARAAQAGPWTPPAPATTPGEAAVDEAARANWNSPTPPPKSGMNSLLDVAKQEQARPSAPVIAAPARIAPPASSGAIPPQLSSDEIARIEWQAWPRLRNEFASLEAYQAHRRGGGGWIGKAPAATQGSPAIPPSLAHLSIEDRCKAQWSTNPAIRAEFGKLEYLVAFQRAFEAGRVKIYSGKAVQKFTAADFAKK